MFIAYLLLGSNLGDSEKHLSDAVDLIKLRLGKVLKSSSLYCTASWGKHEQPDFLNQVVALDTAMSPDKLLEEVLMIETQLGRERNEMWGSRTIDIDILLFGGEVINHPSLQIPHPFLHKRRFCLQPLNEIAPDIIHPVLDKKVSELLAVLTDNLSVKKLY